jgi:DTW domain-containing protein
MGRHALNSDLFCPKCRFFFDLCCCDVIPKQAVRTRVVVVLHNAESYRQTNTGRLVLPSLEGAELRLKQQGRELTDCWDLHQPDRRLLLLFPGEKSTELTPEFIAQDPRPVTLVVPDGTWPRARKIPLRQPGLQDVQRVSLPAEAPSAYRLRENPHPHKISTFEAIARALERLEGASGTQLRERMEYLFRVARDRIMWSQGELPEADVEGGLAFRERS